MSAMNALYVSSGTGAADGMCRRTCAAVFGTANVGAKPKPGPTAAALDRALATGRATAAASRFTRSDAGTMDVTVLSCETEYKF
jgi:hypothetical protein